MDDVLSAEGVLRSRELHGHALASYRAGREWVGLQRLLCQSESRPVTLLQAALTLKWPLSRYLVDLACSHRPPRGPKTHPRQQVSSPARQQHHHHVI